MKNKYQRMSKDEKKDCKKNYYKTTKGKEMQIRLTRLLFTGIIGILFSLYIVFNGYRENTMTWYFWLLAVILFIASLVFIVMSFRLKGKCLNEFAIKNNK